MNIIAEKRGRRKANSLKSLIKKEDVRIPEKYGDWKGSKFEKEWLEALNNELTSMQKLGVFEVVDKPPGRKLMSTKYVFEVKDDKDGYVERFKVRMVARGFSQIEGIDYFETYGGVATATTIRTICGIIAQFNLKTREIDVATAYLYSPVEEELFMEIPSGYREYIGEKLEGKCLRLKKALYGTKQGANAWFKTLNRFLEGNGFRKMQSVESLYKKAT